MLVCRFSSLLETELLFVLRTRMVDNPTAALTGSFTCGLANGEAALKLAGEHVREVKSLTMTMRRALNAGHCWSRKQRRNTSIDRRPSKNFKSSPP